MRLETFFEKFELFADAPNAVGKMRELVRQLAVQGTLVDQDPSDEPASTHLEGMRKTKAKLIKDRVIRRQDTDPISDDEAPFAIPTSWVWTRLGEIGDWGSGSTPMRGNHELYGGGITWLKSGELNDNEALAGSGETVSELALKTGSFRRNQSGDVLLAMYGATIGKVAILAEPAVTNQAVCGCTPFAGVVNRYLFNYLISQRAHFHAASEGGAQPNISKVKIVGHPFPLPPLAEQERIVAKVDELMALCDRLEAQQQERDTRHAALARASLARFAEAPTPAHLDFLFHTAYAITPAELRKAILSLAVQGKLVAQDPRDEAADCCLARLGLKSTLVSSNGADELEDALPPAWTRVRFEDVAIVAGGVTLGRKLSGRKTVSLPYLRVANVKRGVIDLSVIKEVSIAEDEIERYALRANDLLMTEGGDWDKVGRAAIWGGQIPVCLHQNHVFRSRMRSAEIGPVWFERYFNSPGGRGYFESASKQTTNLASINMRQVRGCPVPFPPLAEQRRIVAKVDQLMAMVDRLEAQLAEAKAKSTALLDAIIHELLNPTAEVVDLAAYRAAIGCYAIGKMGNKRYFGRTAAMKLFYLAQAHVGLELGLQPLREAAGPLDPWIYRFEEEGARKSWFKVAASVAAGGKTKIEYQPGRALAEQSARAERLLSVSQRRELDRLFGLLADRKTEEAEIIATLFAAWNDFLIDGHTPSDEKIVTEVREHWHETKKRFTPTQLRHWLAWLREHKLVPTGRLPHTVHQPQLC